MEFLGTVNLLTSVVRVIWMGQAPARYMRRRRILLIMAFPLLTDAHPGRISIGGVAAACLDSHLSTNHQGWWACMRTQQYQLDT